MSFMCVRKKGEVVYKSVKQVVMFETGQMFTGEVNGAVYLVGHTWKERRRKKNCVVVTP